MKGWLDNFGKADNANESSVNMSEDFVGLGYNTEGRNYSPAWGGQFQEGGKLNPLSPMQQVQQAVQPTPTVPYLQTKDPSEFYKSWIQSPEYAKRQLLTGYSEGEDLYMPNAAETRESRLGAIEEMTPITYNTREPSKADPGISGSPSYVNINPSDYAGTSKKAIEAHELAHIAGAMGNRGQGTRKGGMSSREQEIFKESMLPMAEPKLSGAQGSKEREASKMVLEDFQHSQKPDEAKADLDALRFMMYDKGIYDITKGKKFTETDFQKAKQNLGNDRVFKRLENRMGKGNFVKLMNTIASADNQEELPMAMGGMSIPGSVGFSYARVSGAAPSKGKHAKKTMASAQNGIMSPMLLARNVLNYFYPSEEAAPTVSAAPVNYKKGLTNELLQRQAYKESTFNPAAVSPAGYKGLTQIGEGVLEDYSNKKGGKKLDPFDPEDAVELQKFAMDDLYNASFINKPNQSDSVRIAKTLAAYNWGRGNLSNYLNEQKSKGIDIYDSYDWLNNLPKETSDYVNKILLQEDLSFNKNYKKASTNPKYEEVTSLYDQKKFGGDIPSAQNGEEDIKTYDLPEITVTPYDEEYPFYQTLSPEQKRYINDSSPIGRGIRAIATTGKIGQTAKDISTPYRTVQEVASEVTGIPGAVRFGKDPIGNLLGLERTLFNTAVSSSPFLPTTPYNQEDLQSTFNTIDALGLASGMAAPFIKPIQQGLKSAGKLSKAGDPLEAVSKISSQNLSPAPLTQAPTSWSMQEAPGLHLKSTMSDGAVSKIVETKTGLINVEQALAIIGKESGGPDKVALIKQGIGENIPKKMDYNEFRKTVQDQLIPLERQFATGRSDYGLDAIGYYGKPFFDEYNNVYRVHGAKDLSFKTQEEAMSFAGKNNPLENQTLILGNKGRFGRGSSAHNNPDETLGHIHFLRDAETPDVLTVTQIQSDAFQGTHRNMPKNVEDAAQKLNETKSDSDYVLESFGKEGDKERFKALFDNVDKYLQLDQNALENFTQKSLLDKNHQERYLQELVNYAGERGDINKLRLPTSETAAKVQGYSKMTSNELDWISEGQKVKFKDGEGTINDDMIFSNSIDIKLPNGKTKLVPIEELKLYNKELVQKIEPKVEYSPSDETILKKYAEQPKTIKKLFGIEPKIVTDAKGNSWYEFDIPKSFKEGKGEIKAFKNGGGIPSAQKGKNDIEKISINDPRYPELHKNRQVGAYYDGAYSLPDLPEVVVTGKDERLKEAMYEGSNKFGMNALGLMSAPQVVTMEALTGKQQTPSEAFGFQQTGGWLDSPTSFGKNLGNLAMDAALDPINLIGVGIADDIVRTTLKGFSNPLARKAAQEVVPEFIPEKIVFDLMDESIDPFAQVLKNIKIHDTPSPFAKDVQREAFKYQKLARDPRYLERVKNIDRDFGSRLEPLLNEFKNDEIQNVNQYFPFNISIMDEIPHSFGGEPVDVLGISSFNTEGSLKNAMNKGVKYPQKITPSTDRYIEINEPRHLRENAPARGTVHHELKHHWTNALLDTENKNYEQALRNLIARRSEAGIDPRDVAANQDYNYLSRGTEVDAHLMTNLRDEMVKRGYLKDYFDELSEGKLNDFLSKEKDYRGVGEYFNPSKPMVANKSKFVDFFNTYGLPSTVIGGVLGGQAIDQQRNGGITKDNQGYWNPDNWGKPVEIDSNDITMEPSPYTGVEVPYNVLGVSDTGDTKLMQPGKNYKFKGKKVTEYPVAKLGINQLDAQPMKKLNQLLNFTNNPDKDNWLDKYN